MLRGPQRESKRTAQRARGGTRNSCGYLWSGGHDRISHANEEVQRVGLCTWHLRREDQKVTG